MEAVYTRYEANRGDDPVAQHIQMAAPCVACDGHIRPVW
jgi:hypothetical protein